MYTKGYVMSSFQNVWTSDPRPSHQCLDCGEIVYNLSGVMGHICKEGDTMYPDGNTWIRANIDFGVPWKRLAIPLRSMIGRNLYSKLEEFRSVEPKEMEKVLSEIINTVRPELKDWHTIYMFTYNPMRGSLVIEVISPKFDKVNPMNMPPLVFLEKCPLCKGDISADGLDQYMKQFGDECKMICKSCYEADTKEVVCHTQQG